jgi:non-homologous end joining protein Ku
LTEKLSRRNGTINFDKVKGREITAAPQHAAKPGPIIDLMEALRQSMKKVPEKKAAATPRKTRKKA